MGGGQGRDFRDKEKVFTFAQKRDDKQDPSPLVNRIFRRKEYLKYITFVLLFNFGHINYYYLHTHILYFWGEI